MNASECCKAPLKPLRVIFDNGERKVLKERCEECWQEFNHEDPTPPSPTFLFKGEGWASTS